MDERRFEDRKEPEIVYSKSVKAGKRIYYLDVKKARNEDLYLCITESKKRIGEDDVPQFEKHKIFLYKEDFASFVDSLEDVINFVKARVGDIESRATLEKEERSQQSEVIEQPAEEEKPRRGLLGRLLN